MIDDMASLKQAMEQMDAEDVAVAQAAKDRAAQILRDAKLSFSKMAELIEQRRLLLPPKIVASIKRMDQPDLLGDAAFRDTGRSLRSEGQSFRQIAEAIELIDRPAPRNEDPVRQSEPLHQLVMESEPPAWLGALDFVTRIVFFPLRHPIRFLFIALLVIWLLSALRDVVPDLPGVGVARQLTDAVRSFVDKRILGQSQEAAAPPTPPAPVPSPSAAPSPPSASPSIGPATPSAPPATAPAPSAKESTPPAPSPAAPAGPPASTPRLDTRAVPPSNSAAKDRPRTVHSGAFEQTMPEGLRRKSQGAGPCIGGVGGCYWGGDQY